MRFLALLLVLASATTAAAQSKTDSDRYFHLQVKIFSDYAKDLLAFAKAHQSDSSEFEKAEDLEHLASDTAEYLGAAGTLLMVYDTVDVADQAKITPIIKLQISHYVKETDLDVEAVNNNLAYTTVPALAITGDRMKKDLRDVREKLDSLQNSLKQ